MQRTQAKAVLARGARSLAHRAGVQRRQQPPWLPVPRLRRATAPTGAPPTAWMINPHWEQPSGGIRKVYRAVDVLNEAGLAAAVVHDKAGFKCEWFEHDTRVVAARDVVVGEHDVIVVPEIYWQTFHKLPAGVRQVVFNQNVYRTLDSLGSDGPAATAAYAQNPDLAAVITVSAENADAMRYAFPDLPVIRMHHSLDTTVHHPPAALAPQRIAYMPRRRADEAGQVLELLRAHGALAGWELMAIDGRSERGVADALRESRIFLSFSHREGFGLPPCEALACGCHVVGFDGFAGREFFRPPYATAVENGDVVTMARTVEALMRRTEADPAWAWETALAGSALVTERYTPEAERRDLVGAFSSLLTA